MLPSLPTRLHACATTDKSILKFAGTKNVDRL